MEKFIGTDNFTEQLRIQKESLLTLLNHMPALTFTKDVETGVYLACNQAFADYAHKETPEEVAGLTDFEIFEHSVAAHFVEDDKKALSQEEPYVFYEDVADAVGNPRQFQTTKLKFHDESGRLCLLGMCMDVTGIEQMKQELEQEKNAYKQAMNSREIYENIVDALSEDYFNLYYIDLKTDDYIEYGSRTGTGHRAIETRGKHFFDEAQKNALKFIYKEDQPKFQTAMNKAWLTAEIKKYGMFIMQYRLLVNGEPVYVNLKATFGGSDQNQIIIGVNNIDAQIKDQAAAQRAREDRKAYLRFSALNNNLIVLYLVNLETDKFSEYTATKNYEELGIEKEGDDFFGTTYKNSLRTVYPEDQELFHSNITKEKILEAIEKDGSFVLDYRLLIEGTPSYVRLKAARVEEDGKSTLIIGLMDEDSQIRQQKKIVDDLSAARRMASIDSLTGVKNKYSYSQAEERMNQRIAEGLVSEFSVAVFDLNDLKTINDTLGHEIGNEYIKEASRMICTCFKHSPVFRIGGDEFAAILEGADHTNKEELFESFEKLVLGNMERGKAVVSFGCSSFNMQQDRTIRSVFERADALMYTEKMFLKSLGSSKEDDSAKKTEAVPEFEEITPLQMRKHILIADDIESNREILGDLLRNDYDILYASDGEETMEMLRKHKEDIALVILDLYMPRMNGREVMNQMQVDEELMFIPVVFISVDLEAELDCLKIGAMDFIPKPYPNIEIIRARIDRCIELSENRDLIRRTQKDRLTGLYNYDYFIRYIHRFDRHYRDTAFDAVTFSITGFRLLTEQYGQQFGDLVLRSIGIGINKLLRKTGGIGCRKEGDAFMLYCPHRDDYEQLLDQFVSDLFIEEKIASKVLLKFGVFLNAQQEPEAETRFIRARAVLESIAEDPKKNICVR